MKKVKRVLRFLVPTLALIGLALTMSGCRIFGNDDEGTYTAPASVELVTNVTQPTEVTLSNIVAANMAKGVRPAVTVTSNPLTGATVVVTLSDGTQLNMTEVAGTPGRYRCVLGSLAGLTGLMIEARKGELVVQNLVTNVDDIAGSSQTPLETNFETTAFTQLALAFGQKENAQYDTPAKLLPVVQTLQTNLQELREEILSQATQYLEQLNFFAQALKAAVTTLQNVEKDILQQLQEGTKTIEINNEQKSFSQIVTAPIQDGTLLPPINASTDEAKDVATVLDKYLTAFGRLQKQVAATNAEKDELAAILDADFLGNGKNKDAILAMVQNPPDDGEKLVSYSLTPVLKKVEITPQGNIRGLVESVTYYLGGVQGTVTLMNTESGRTFTQNVNSFANGWNFKPDASGQFLNFSAANLHPEPFFPVILKKDANGAWKVLGNKVRVEDIDFNVNVFKDLANPNTSYKSLWAKVEGTGITGIVVRGPGLPQNGQELQNINNGNEWGFVNNGSFGTYPAQALADFSLNPGARYTFTVTFTGDVVQTFELTVPTTLPSTALGGSVAKNTNNTGLIISWNQSPDEDFEEYQVTVAFVNNDDAETKVSQSYTNKTQLSHEFLFNDGETYEVKPNQLIKFWVEAFTKRGFSRNFFGTFPYGIDPNTKKFADLTAMTSQLLGKSPSGVPPLNPSGSNNIRAAITGPIPNFPDTWRCFTGADRPTALPADATLAALGLQNAAFLAPGGYPGVYIGFPFMQMYGADGSVVTYGDSGFSSAPVTYRLAVYLSRTLAPYGNVNFILKTKTGKVIPLSGVQSYSGDYGFEGIGTVNVQLSQDVSVPATLAITNVSSNLNGTDVSGQFTVTVTINTGSGNVVYTIENGTFDEDGLVSATVKANGATIGTIARNQNGEVRYTDTLTGTSQELNLLSFN